MTWAKYGLVVVGLFLAVASIASTGGVSSTAADRNIEGAVVSDDKAYLGIEELTTTGTVNETFSVLRLMDNFAPDVDLQEISISESDEVTLQTSAPEEMDRATEIEITCVDAGRTEVTFDITVSGSGVMVSLQRTVRVTCEEPVS